MRAGYDVLSEYEISENLFGFLEKNRKSHGRILNHEAQEEWKAILHDFQILLLAYTWGSGLRLFWEGIQCIHFDENKPQS